MRSLLFAGATRPDLVAKLPRSRPDAAVVDLEDAVPADHKEAAREAARRLGRELAAAHPSLDVYVRVNAVPTRWFAGDVAEGVDPTVAGVVIPKLEEPAQLAALRSALADHGLGGLRVVAGIETARGVAHVERLLDLGVHAAYFGAEDYIADMGGVRTADGDEALYARSRVALAARVAGVIAVDQAVVDVRDEEAFRRDAEQGRAMGFGGKICVHPRQAELANAAFGADAEQCDRARRLLAAWEAAAAGGVGAIEFEGAMVDEPALRMAREVLARGGA
ncbi:CoA ester lyase [Baekduia soli]|uniref:CoA ester lyase n=1 Tax=Baekduia soli TaxID=496014 RepID=A0A5B8U0F2_9ACTN|nr:CoA ester lyase [Baekduia soli]QEC46484.1 CoA ester lyase [Baekduia soli]